ncbi:hypothetical protein QC764_305705 [Podospora pseudoanserina]|uniref:Uncharacterized protein n=1 Tax=Podospora pseudoanserina TaxID=2609844 RepID=A0ABR0ICT8_9PEZI|nr:hypothetical protein QC764_305705 [Podospora pseudoanserina]
MVGATCLEDEEPDTESVTVGVATRLAQVFGFFTEAIEDMRLTIFNGEEKPNGKSLTFHDIGPIAPFGENENTNGIGIDLDANPDVLPPPRWRSSLGVGGGCWMRGLGRRSLTSGFGRFLVLFLVPFRAFSAFIMRDSSSEGRDRWCNKAGALDIDDPHLTREIEDTAMNSFANYDINIEHVYRNAIACQDKLGDGQFDEWNSVFNNMGTGFLQAPPMDENGYPECFWGSLPVFSVTDASRENALAALAVEAATDGICVSTAFPGPFKSDLIKAPEYLGVNDCPYISGI